jgi:hypothetical protein
MSTELVRYPSAGVEFQCDFCHRRPEFYAGDFRAALSEAKKDGWRAPMYSKEWTHYCPECAKEKNLR